MLEAYVAGTMLDTLQNGTQREVVKDGLSAEEAAVLWLLRQQLDLAIAS